MGAASCEEVTKLLVVDDICGSIVFCNPFDKSSSAEISKYMQNMKKNEDLPNFRIRM